MSDSLHIVCPHCQSVNRVPAGKLADQPNCGRCQQPLFTGAPIELTTATFTRHVERSDIPLLVDFWAPWCGPCKMMAPQFQQAARLLEPKVRLAKVDTEAEPPWPGRRPAKACRLRQRPAAWRHPSAALRRRPCRRPVACPANPSRDRRRTRRASSRSPWHTCRRSWKSCRYWAQAFSAGSSAQRPWALHQASAATTHQGRRPWEFSICEGIASWLAQGMEQGPGQLRRERP